MLIAQYHQPLYSLIARSLNDPADAADITQEVFIKVFRSIRGFHGEASLRTWLYRIALREASNQRRWWSRHKKQEITIDSPYESDSEDEGNGLCLSATLADHSDSPFDHAAQAESANVSKPLSASCPRPSALSSSSARLKASPTKRSPRSLTSTSAPSSHASPVAVLLSARYLIGTVSSHRQTLRPSLSSETSKTAVTQ